MLLITLLAIPLMLVTGQIAYGGPNPGPPVGMHLSGPAIVGTITITSTAYGWILANFQGHCKGQPVTIVSTPIPLDITSVTEEILEGYNLSYIGPPGCRSDFGGELILINTVTKFTQFGDDMITADAVILFAVP